MTTTQTTTALALAEQELKNRFKNAKKQINPYTSQTHYPERNELEKELRELLEYEFNDWKSHHRNRYSWKTKNPLTPAQLLHKQETLSLFKSAFDWDTNYEMEVGYETYPNECSHTYEIKDEEELKALRKEYQEKRMSGLRSALQARQEADKLIQEELRSMGYKQFNPIPLGRWNNFA